MRSTVIFTICVLSFFGAQALGGKDENGTKIEESIQALDYQHASVIVSDPIQNKVKRSQTPEKCKTNGEGNQKMELKDQLQTKMGNECETQLNKRPPTKDETKVIKLQDQPLTNMEENSDPFVKNETKDQITINTEEHGAFSSKLEYKDERPNNTEKGQKTERNEWQSVRRFSTKLEDSRISKFKDRLQIKVTESAGTDLEKNVNSTWTQMQTRGKDSAPGPILGFKKGTFKRNWSIYLTQTSSYLGRKLSIRKKQGKPGPEKQESFNEEPQSAPSKPSSWSPMLNAWQKRGDQTPTQVPTRPTRQNSLEKDSLEYSIESIVMIPGAGEFVYDIIIQQRTPVIKGPPGRKRTYGTPESINENNNKGKSDAMLSLDQLEKDLPNVKWVSVVVNWFADSLNINDCEIYPAVEYRDDFIMTDDWQVEYLARNKARLISRDGAGNPRYGGTVSDSALKRYIKELHRRGYKVMLYPMLVLDTEQKEWRGRLTGKPGEIRTFFEDKYTRFIRHYAFMAKHTKVEGFIIGSEFVGLTKVQEKPGVYPAVTALVKLAKEVKNIVEDPIIVTYAADWTEYHISSKGWYPMDELWGSKYIDVVGINAYFPLTDDTEPEGGWSVDDIIRSWTAGEGYYYFSDHSKRIPDITSYPGRKDSKWAWKNIENWWSNPHFNPDGSGTKWVPKSKQIWFTEFGFPSVDACTNEPYVFVDASSTESKYPRYSNRKVSFQSQRTAIEGTVKEWRNSEMVERMFLYAWDARPFPFFPKNREVWGDGLNWESGHWVQGKTRTLIGDKRESVVSYGQRTLSSPKRTGSSNQVRRVLSNEEKS